MDVAFVFISTVHLHHVLVPRQVQKNLYLPLHVLDIVWRCELPLADRLACVWLVGFLVIYEVHYTKISFPQHLLIYNALVQATLHGMNHTHISHPL